MKFKIKKAKEDLFKDANIVIWTTTPWTLPGNRAIAFSENFDYIIVSLYNYVLMTTIDSMYVMSTGTGVNNTFDRSLCIYICTCE